MLLTLTAQGVWTLGSRAGQEVPGLQEALGMVALRPDILSARARWWRGHQMAVAPHSWAPTAGLVTCTRKGEVRSGVGRCLRFPPVWAMLESSCSIRV